MARLFSEYFPELTGNNPVQMDIPVDLGDLLDANGNEYLEVDAVASAVNHFRVANAAASSGPTLSSAGDDTNIPITIAPKGTGAINLTPGTSGVVITGGPVDASAVALKSKRNVLASSGNTTMTSAMSGSVMLLDGAATDYALPAIGAGDIGMYFDFVSTIIATDQTITAQAADLLTGSVTIVAADDAAGTDAFAPDVSDDLVITLNGTTKGGVAVGSWLRLTAISATRWFVEGILVGSGTVETPFS